MKNRDAVLWFLLACVIAFAAYTLPSQQALATSPLTVQAGHSTTLSSSRMRYYSLSTINAGPINLISEGGMSTREIIIEGSGTLDVTPETPIGDGGGGTDESGPVEDGMVLPWRVTALGTSTSGITGVWVMW